MELLLHIVEVGHCGHIVIFGSIGVDADELDARRDEGKVEFGTKHFFPDLVARTQKVMIANQHNVGLVELLENIITPLKFACGSCIGEVAAMNNKVDAVVGID